MCERNEKFEKRSLESGFSLIEVLIAVVIFLVVIAAIFGVLRIGLITRDTINDRGETIASARTAVNSVGREAVNAGLGFTRVGAIVPDDFASGLLDIPQDSNALRDLFTGVMAGDEISDSDLSLSGEKNDIITFVYRDLNYNGGQPLVIVDTVETEESFKLDTGLNGCVNCNKFDVLLIEDAEGNQALAIADGIESSRYIKIKDNDPLGLNRRAYDADDDDINDPEGDWSVFSKCPVGQTANCFSYNPQATAKRIFISSYSVNDEGTLVRTTYGNNTGENANRQIQVQPLAYGVQRFQVKYLMQDGTKLDDPSEGNTNQSAMNNVVQVEIKITIRAEGSEQGVTGTQIINLTSTFSTRNLRYDNE